MNQFQTFTQGTTGNGEYHARCGNGCYLQCFREGIYLI